jgi:hypothetical protein
MSQPFRAGLTFGSRPYGPASDLRFISSSHADSLAHMCLGFYGTRKAETVMLLHRCYSAVGLEA